jgi:hypothetical protein
MSGLIAVVLLLNGVQIDLPSPAGLLQGSVCVPLRSVCERAGATVEQRKSGAKTLVVLHAIRKTYQFECVAKLPPQGGSFCVMHGGTAYVPARRLAQLCGGLCVWQPATRTLDLRLPWLGAGPVKTTCGEIREAPLRWRDKMVQVEGRNLGRSAAHLSPAGAMPEELEDGFVLGAEAAISCSTQEYAATVAVPTVFSSLGRPLRVTGRVGIDENGLPRVKPLGIRDLSEDGRLSLWLSADRKQFPQEQTAQLELVLTNSAKRAIRAPGELILTVREPSGATWDERRDRLSPTGLTGGDLLPGSGVSLRVPVPGGSTVGRHGQGVWSAEARIGGDELGAQAGFERPSPGGLLGGSAR